MVNILDRDNENIINIGEFINILRIKWFKIFLSGVLVALLSFCYFNFFVTEKYSASAQLFIDIRKVSSEGKDTYIDASHIMAAKELASTYTYIIETNVVLENVINELDLDMSQGALASKISVSIIEDTPVLKLSVIDEDRTRAYKIVSKIVEIAPEIINAKIDSGKLVSIDNPTVSSSPVSPNVMRNTAIAFVIGVCTSCAFFMFLRMIDNKIKSPEDIQRILDMPFLGTIPSLEHIQRK